RGDTRLRAHRRRVRCRVDDRRQHPRGDAGRVDRDLRRVGGGTDRARPRHGAAAARLRLPRAVDRQPRPRTSRAGGALSTLSAAVRTTLGTFTLDVAFEIDSPSITSLFGRSGAGKSTVLRCLDGPCRPRSARLEVGGEGWQDGRCFVPPHRRAVGLVFQDAALFPHKDVAGNLRYGLSRVPKARRRIAFDDVVRWLDLERLLERRCASLSGGERQRVALARAILTSPRLLLLDEPLASLDRDSRRAILPYLERLPARLAIPVVLVTHSLTEVARLADRVVVLADGRVTASGPTTAILPELDAETFGGTEAAVVEGTVEAH